MMADRIFSCGWLLLFGGLSSMGTGQASIAQERPQLIGNQACATATCHGGVVDVGPAWHSSANAFESRDPHNKAGEVLLGELSQRMITALEPNARTADERLRVLVDRCASCHAPAATKNISPVVGELSGTSAAESQLRQIHQGVSCETCHGAASNWLVPHTQARWPLLPPAERYADSMGMLNTEDLAIRSDNCARCHIGSRSTDGLVRDMNHDMIAAGHPQLRLNMSELLSRLPAHWDHTRDAVVQLRSSRGKSTVDDALRDRMLLAALKLSLDRTAQSSADRSESNGRSAAIVPQPELSEYDCVACHRPYIANTQRPSRGLPRWQPELTQDLSLQTLPELKGQLSNELIWGRKTLASFLSGASQELDQRSLQLLRLTPSVEPGRGAQ